MTFFISRKRPLVALTIGLCLAAVAATAGVAADRNGPSLPPNKQAQLTHEYQQLPNAPHAIKEPSYQPPAEPTPPPAPDLGQVVLDPPQVPLPAEMFTATSGWSDLHGDVMIHVYAGSKANNPAVGEIYLSETNQKTGTLIGGSGLYTDPAIKGPLVLTAVSGSTVGFAFPGGSATFDLTTELFSP